jgi:hypothetical protein
VVWALVLSGCLGSVERRPAERDGSSAPSNSAIGQSPLPPAPPPPAAPAGGGGEAGAISAIDALGDLEGATIDGLALEAALAQRRLSVVRHFVGQIEGLGASCVSQDRQQIGASASFLIASEDASQLASILIYRSVEERELLWTGEGLAAVPVPGTICHRFVTRTADPPGAIGVRANVVMFFPTDLAYGGLPGPGTGTDRVVRELILETLEDLP